MIINVLLSKTSLFFKVLLKSHGRYLSIMENNNTCVENIHNEIERTNSIESIVSIRRQSKNTNRWRANSFFHFVSNPKKKRSSSVVPSRKSTGSLKTELTNDNSSSALSVVPVDTKSSKLNALRNSIVTIVLVEAKCLPPVPDDGASHNLYCKFRLGNATYKSKTVAGSTKPEWRERFKLHLLKDDSLKISVWDKGKQKNFMGSCVLDLSSLEAERTHEIWQQLEDGYGQIHLSVTICSTRSNNSPSSCLFSLQDFQQRHAILNMTRNWELVGLLHVNVLGAKGFAGRPNAYCTLELDNERVQTPQEKATSEPNWNKCYVFNVYDVTSTLDVKVYDGSLLSDSLGKVSIPLLRIANGQMRWYALKDKSKRHIAKGNCPRVCLQMSLMWNPIKASMRLFRPRPVKYVKKPPKFDIALVYSNLEFVRDVFNFLYRINEYFKQLFEWDDAESSFLALIGWLIFCSYFQLWTVPLLLLLPFLYHWLANRYQDNRYRITRNNSHSSEADTNNDKNKDEKSITGKILGIQVMTLTITNGVEYIASVVERLFNLVTYKVPFLSILTMIILVISSFVLYFVPFNYLLMALGIYKFTRKYLNPNRVLNNDLLDFISRVPDNEILKDWKELSVPEPVQPAIQSSKLARSVSSDCSDVAPKN